MTQEEDVNDEGEELEIIENDCCNKRRCSIITEVILLLVGLGAVVQIFFIPDTVEEYFLSKLKEQFLITSETAEKNDTIWTHWISNEHDDSPMQKFSYSLFNITNPYDILNGEIANLTEIGPFVYRRYEYRIDPIFLENDTIVDYTYHYKFEYLADESTPDYSLDDRIVVINPALQTFIFGMNTLYVGIHPVFETYFQSLNGSHAFYFTTIEKVLWNISDPIMEEYFADTLHINLNTFFSAINFASNHVTEYTGKDNLNNMRLLIRYFNKTNIDFWGCFNDTNDDYLNSTYYEKDEGIYYDATCNTYNESIYAARETKNFPYDNFVDKNSELIVWGTEKYRKVSYFYEKEVTNHGIPMYRFTLSENTFKNATNYPPNNHYYQFGLDGIINLTNRHSEPLRQTVVYMSKGHFLEAPYYVEQVNRRMGLRDPDSSLDDQYFDIEPRTGAVFHRYLSYMATLGVFPLIGRSNQPFGNITEQMIPMYGLTVNAEATDDQYSTLKANLLTLDTTIDISIYGGASLAIVCFGIMLWLIYRRKHRQSQLEKEEKKLKINKNNKQNKKPIMSPSLGLMHSGGAAPAGPIGTGTPHETAGIYGKSPASPGGTHYGSNSSLRNVRNNNNNNGNNNNNNNNNNDDATEDDINAETQKERKTNRQGYSQLV